MRLNILMYTYFSLFSVSLLVVVNKFFLFIYIDDDQFISLDAWISFSIYTLKFLCINIYRNNLSNQIFFLKKNYGPNKTQVRYLVVYMIYRVVSTG
jgi:hypothetical protein